VACQSTLRRARSVPCPPRADHSVVSGPWSLDWLCDQLHSTVGLVSSSRKCVRKGTRTKGGGKKEKVLPQRRKKVEGALRHPMHSLKKVARLPSKDRKAVMHILKKGGRKYQGSSKLKNAVTMLSREVSEDSVSSNSVTNDWENWVVLHGSEKLVREDVRNIGESIGVQFNGSHNMFGVLAKRGQEKKRVVVKVEGGSRGSGTNA